MTNIKIVGSIRLKVDSSFDWITGLKWLLSVFIPDLQSVSVKFGVESHL